MKRTAQFFILWIFLILVSSGPALAQIPINISPTSEGGTALVISGCPTFSWSEVEDAVSYQVAVFELDELSAPTTYDEIALLKTPVLEHTIPDRGLSWTPSADRCLQGGTYIWYVAAVSMEGIDEWSEGRKYRVDALASFASVSGNAPDEVDDPELHSQDTTNDGGYSPLSLEQIIESNVALQILSTSGEDTQKANESLNEDAVLMGTEAVANTYYGLDAGANCSGSFNSFFGRNAGKNTQKDYNTFVGHDAGESNTTGEANTFIGGWSGKLNSSGYSNTFIGKNSGGRNTTGASNTFVGTFSGWYTTTGGANTFIGRSAGEKNTTGIQNTFLGRNSGYNNTTADNNTYLGYYSGYKSTTGQRNTFVGMRSGYNNTTSDNTMIGYYSGYSNTTGAGNTFIGSKTGQANTTGDGNTFIGDVAGSNNTTGRGNTFIGWNAGLFNTVANYNTFIGMQAGYSNNEGYGNTFIGANAGLGNEAGDHNTFLGINAGYKNETNGNTFIGYGSGYANTAGSQNTFLGTNAGQANTVGPSNTFIGYQTGYSNTSGLSNTFIGTLAGNKNKTGNFNVFLGSGAGYNETGSNKLYIDSTTSSSPLIYGEFNNDLVRVNGVLGVGKMPATALDVNGTATATAFVGNGSGLTNIQEADPQVGAVTNSKWCVGNGSAVQCTQTAPVIAEADPQVGAVTNAKWCVGDGSAVQCNQTAPDRSSSNEIQTLSLVGSTLSISKGNSVNIAGGEADDLGNHTATQALNLNGNWLSGDGDDEGIYIEPTGDIRATGVLTVAMAVSPSDERFKKDIRPIEAPLQKLMELSGISYNWRNKDFKARGFSNGRQIGLIAQDVEGSFPELVHTDGDGYKAVDYSKMTAVLVEAVKELKAENETLKTQNKNLKAKLEKEIDYQQSQIDEMRTLIEKLSG